MKYRGPAILAAVTLVFLYILLSLVVRNKIVAHSPSLELDGTSIESAQPEPNVELIDQDGHPFRLIAKRGREVVLFFGYAHCPDICPTTLGKLAQADRSLGAQARNVVVAFVTVDPERDTVPVLKRYVRLFDRNFYGLTGSRSQLHAVYHAYHVWHQKLPNHGSAAGYLMAHSSTIYMLDRSGRLRVIHDWNDQTDELAHDMKALLQ